MVTGSQSQDGEGGPKAASPRGRGSFEETIWAHLNLVYQFALRLTGNSADAEDLVQETFLRAHRAFDRFDLREHGPRAWLFKILHNVFLTRRAQATRRPTLLDDVDFDHFAAELEREPLPYLADGQVDWENFDEELKDAVEDLPPEYREALLLWALGDLSYKEIAEVLDCPIGTVMSRLYRARQMVGAQLADYAARRGFQPRGSAG